MVKRCIYFCIGNHLRKITTEIPWDLDSMEINKRVHTELVIDTAPEFLKPCEEISIGSDIWKSKCLSTNFVKSDDGISVQRLWKALDNIEIEKGVSSKPGLHEYIYLHCLKEEQIFYALNVRSFSDMFHNPDKTYHTNAVALCALQLLQKQDKLDYLNNINMFSEWFYVNISQPIEYVEDRDKDLQK